MKLLLHDLARPEDDAPVVLRHLLAVAVQRRLQELAPVGEDIHRVLEDVLLGVLRVVPVVPDELADVPLVVHRVGVRVAVRQELADADGRLHGQGDTRLVALVEEQVLVGLEDLALLQAQEVVLGLALDLVGQVLDHLLDLLAHFAVDRVATHGQHGVADLDLAPGLATVELKDLGADDLDLFVEQADLLLLDGLDLGLGLRCGLDGLGHGRLLGGLDHGHVGQAQLGHGSGPSLGRFSGAHCGSGFCAVGYIGNKGAFY